ncbi:MAG TPA: autotransporter domain-containing protein [Hyphomicrobiaceae bacterium]|nr:autotransporter domain-containing protein [Hyphomicrobiaceae bacterium]
MLLALLTQQAFFLEPAWASASRGCSAINAGELDVEVALGSPLTRSFELRAGDTVGIYNRGRAEIALTITSRQAGAPLRTAHLAAGAAPHSFSAPESGTFTFRLSVEGSGGAAGATCVAALAADVDPAADASFLARRADRLIAEEPDRARLRRQEPGLLTPDAKIPGVVKFDEEANKARQLAFSVSLAEIAAAHSAKPAPGILDFWFEGRYGNFDDAMPDGVESDASLGVVYFGSQLRLRPEIMVGTIAQLDRTSESDPHAHYSAEGSGWMVGPYASLQLSPGVFLDARAAWGLADNEVAAADGSHVFATERQLLRSRLTGTRELGAWRVAPSLSLTYFEETPRQAGLDHRMGMGHGRVEVLPRVSYRTHLDGDTFIEPRATVGVFWNFDALGELADPSLGGGADARLKAEAGLAIGTKSGTTINATAGVEDAGPGTPDAWSGRFQLNMPLK